MMTNAAVDWKLHLLLLLCVASLRLALHQRCILTCHWLRPAPVPSQSFFPGLQSTCMLSFPFSGIAA